MLSALRDAERIKKARLHPLAILLALKTYAQGRGDKGKLTWEPVPQVIDALNAAFYTAFAAIVPCGKRILLALDVSGSMAGGGIAGTSLTPREGSAAMALMTAATEENYHIVGFTTSGGDWRSNTRLTPLPLTPSMRLDDAVKAVSNLPFGGTDCALPMLHALEKGLKVDAFVVYTDSETWAGSIHPVQALRDYRAKTGIAAKLVVVGMVSNGFSHCGPGRWRDAGCGRLRRRRAGRDRGFHPRLRIVAGRNSSACHPTSKIEANMPVLESICPVCGDTANNSVSQGVAADISCQSCGDFRITWEAASDFLQPFQEDLQKAIARHFIRKLQGTKKPTIELEFLRALSERRLPSPPELCDNLLMYLAEQLNQQPGKQVTFRFDDPMVMAIIGAVSFSDLAWAVDTLRSQGLSYVSGSDVMGGNLTAQGWERVDLLRRARIASRYAFFARKFDNPDLDTAFKQCLRQAVADTGFRIENSDATRRSYRRDNGGRNPTLPLPPGGLIRLQCRSILGSGFC